MNGKAVVRHHGLPHFIELLSGSAQRIVGPLFPVYTVG
jgi:hypothetical protein